MVTDKADREGCSPEMTVLEWADGFKIPAGNSGYGEELQTIEQTIDGQAFTLYLLVKLPSSASGFSDSVTSGGEMIDSTRKFKAQRTSHKGKKKR